MSTRVSTLEIVQSSLYGINDAYSRYDVAQRQVNTGKLLQTPSDNPAGTAQTLDFRARSADIDQYNSIINQAKNFLSTGESALNSVTDLLQQARSIAVQGANGSTSDDTRAALASQLGNIITQIASIGNTSYGSRYVFAGQRTQTAPIVQSGTGYTYAGGSAATGDGDLSLAIGPGETMVINVTGDQVFTPLLQQLQALQSHIAMGASSVVSQSDLANMDTQLNNILSARADMGAKVDRLNMEEQRNTQTKDNYTQLISQIEDADLPKAVVNLQTAQTAYQAALQSTSSVFQMSLLNFLK
jgi:flagellar hook-associated protein 3 FlgL